MNLYTRPLRNVRRYWKAGTLNRTQTTGLFGVEGDGNGVRINLELENGKTVGIQTDRLQLFELHQTLTIMLSDWSDQI